MSSHIDEKRYSVLVGYLTSRKNKYIVTVITDYFSNWPESAPLKDKTAVMLVLLISYIKCFVVIAGLHDIFISDQVREFVNQLSR